MKVQLLSNGEIAAVLTASGGGAVYFDGRALTRWAPDPTLDSDGSAIYLRDADTGDVWSAMAHPIRSSASHAQFDGDRVIFSSTHDEIETRVTVAVAPDTDAELRLIEIRNSSARTRRIELTSYAELVLNTVAGDVGHPGFSKLFVQTGAIAELNALIAWRRLRAPDEQPLWAFQRLIADTPVEHETDRARFVGRGRTLANPQALDCAQLSGTTGNVLDPVFAQRTTLTLDPGASALCAIVLGGAHTEADARNILEQLDSIATVQAGINQAKPAPPEQPPAPTPAPTAAAAAGKQESAEIPLPPSWLKAIEVSTGSWRATVPARTSAATRSRSTDRLPRTSHEELRFFNGIGGFSEDGSEYVMYIGPGKLPPLPWTNVIANESAGFVVSERGAGTTWAGNSRENRITPWHNDPVSDPYSEAFYIRDDATGEVWSPLPGPVEGDAGFEVRHGFGYTRFLHQSHGLDHEAKLFVARQDPVKLALVTLHNQTETHRRLTLYRYAQLVLGVHPADTCGGITTTINNATKSILAWNRSRGEFSNRVAFAGVNSDLLGERSAATNREDFLGRYGDVQEPAAVYAGGPLDGIDGQPSDPCVAHAIAVTLPPGATVQCVFVLGEETSEEPARRQLRHYRDVQNTIAEFDAVREHWRDLLGRVRIETPMPELDLMVNGWLAYQNLACRMFARTALYQSGGAFGFRDQLQDSSSVVYLDPAVTRRQILLHAAHQFEEGDVLHWWHPPLSKGIRTRFADDLLWLPYITGFYLDRTGDTALLDEQARFLGAETLEAPTDEIFVVPEDAGTTGSIYEHCCRAIDRSLTKGAHGLPLMGVGDWNDGMNRVGREGRGESVWLGFFLFDILNRFIPIVEARGDVARAERYVDYRAELFDTLNDTGWDGEWYRRAYYDNGAPLGSAANDECRIDTIAQAWAVISGAAPEHRADIALDAMEQHLVSEREGIIRLLTPAFDRTPHDPGYIKGYLPGVRENGGQYTHAALWAVRALSEAGRNERAASLFRMLSPVSHTRTADEVAIYQAEPYVIAADVYGVAPHIGRGGWTWYTGSAGWMLRVALENILGYDLQPDRILLRPCIPADWPGFTLTHQLPGGTIYRFEVTQGSGHTHATLDREAIAVEDGAVLVPIIRDGEHHTVSVALADDVGPVYRPAQLDADSTAPFERITSA